MSDITEVNAITGEVVTRAYTTAEAEQRNKDLAKHAALADAQAAKALQRQEVLDRLGITAEEAQLLLGGI